MSVPTEFHSTLCRTYHTLWISVRQPIAEWNVAAGVWEIGLGVHEGIKMQINRLDTQDSGHLAID